MNTATSTSAFSPKVVPLPSANSKLMVIEPDYAWRRATIQHLGNLVQLPAGWDGYQGKPVSLMNAYFALKMLDAVCGSDAIAPQIVPGLEGDLQIEWHTLRGDVELHVIGPNRVHGWLSLVAPVPKDEELELDIEFSVVAAWVREIAEQPRAIVAPAA